MFFLLFPSFFVLGRNQTLNDTSLPMNTLQSQYQHTYGAMSDYLTSPPAASSTNNTASTANNNNTILNNNNPTTTANTTMNGNSSNSSSSTNGAKNPSSSSNYSNVNYIMRKERSLDRSSATENFLENLGFVTNNINQTLPHTTANHSQIMAGSGSRRSYVLNPNAATVPTSNASQPSTPQHYPTYANSTLYLNSGNPATPVTSSSNRTTHRQHHRSNSILNGANPLTMLNPLNFTRDYGTSVSVGGGLRASARALSTNSFSTNNLQRDPSANSIKSMYNSNTNDLYSHQQTSQAWVMPNRLI